MNTKVISIVNQKGGVGKTTSTCAIGSILGAIGYKVLIIDTDPQRNSTKMLGYENDTRASFFDAINTDTLDVTSIRETILETNYSNIYLMPGTKDVNVLIDKIKSDNSKIPQLRMKKAINLIKDDYDFILIDNSPVFNIITVNALCASDYVLIPLQADRLSYEGLVEQLQSINEVKSEINYNLEILGIFVTSAKQRTNIFKEVYSKLSDELGGKFLSTCIKLDNAIVESTTALVPLPYLRPNADSVYDYMRLLLEIGIIEDKDKAQILIDQISEKEEKISKKKKS